MFLLCILGRLSGRGAEGEGIYLIIYSIYLRLIWYTLKIAHVMVLCYGMVLHFDFVEICHDSANQVHLFALAAPDFNI